MDEEQQNGNLLKRKVRVIAGEELEAMMVSSELIGREEFQEAIAGYIRLMQANDKPVFINTKFIVYVEPTKIARYHYTEGSLITLSVNGSEGLQTIKVIEPCEVVLQAIEQTRYLYRHINTQYENSDEKDNHVFSRLWFIGNE